MCKFANRVGMFFSMIEELKDNKVWGQRLWENVNHKNSIENILRVKWNILYLHIGIYKISIVWIRKTNFVYFSK